VDYLSTYIRIEEMHFIHIRRIILKIKPSIGDLNLDNNNNNNNNNNNDDDDDDDGQDKRPITLIVDDASGLTITKKGDYYIEQKWIRKKKEFIKLHIAVDDAKSKKVVSFRVTKGNVHS
jgi:hypothetical protein